MSEHLNVVYGLLDPVGIETLATQVCTVQGDSGLSAHSFPCIVVYLEIDNYIKRGHCCRV